LPGQYWHELWIDCFFVAAQGAYAQSQSQVHAEIAALAFFLDQQMLADLLLHALHQLQ